MVKSRRGAVATRNILHLDAEHHRVHEPRSRVILVHGFGEHKRRYTELMERLAGAGHECHIFDLRGHGRSEGPRGHVSAFTDYIDDLDRIVSSVAPDRALQAAGRRGATEPRTIRKLFLVAHSLGGLIALDYVISRPDVFDGLAASNPYLALTLKVPWPLLRAAEMLRYVAPSLRIPIKLDPRLLTHDTAIGESYSSDPLTLRSTTPAWLAETRKAQEKVAMYADKIRLPLLFMLGADDPIASVAQAQQLFGRFGSTDKTLRIYDGLLHEIFNEIGRERVIQDLIGWLDAHARVESSHWTAPPGR